MTRYLLDTNVVSELTRPQPNPGVAQRLERSWESAAISVITWHELHYGLNRLPRSRRKQDLALMLEKLVASCLVLAYDRQAAEVHALLRAALELKGRTASHPDGQIASIALTHGLILVTRNFRHFDCFDGLDVENWFE